MQTLRPGSMVPAASLGARPDLECKAHLYFIEVLVQNWIEECEQPATVYAHPASNRFSVFHWKYSETMTCLRLVHESPDAVDGIDLLSHSIRSVLGTT